MTMIDLTPHLEAAHSNGWGEGRISSVVEGLLSLGDAAEVDEGDNWFKIWDNESHIALVYKPYAFILTTENLQSEAEEIAPDAVVVPALEPYDDEILTVNESKIEELFDWWHPSVDPDRFSPWDLWFATAT